ncbi:MAG TPA: hypothetical protein VE977_03810, partial [Pyrinomonadaceae bacterium]|nr:hypothetical protein [Pyrinomonadaceae bacterium]
KRLAQHSPEAVHELAQLAPLFPLPHSVACSFKNPVHSRLFEWLAQDGWIEDVDADEDEAVRMWRTIHDVFADRMLLSHVCDLGRAGEVFFHELFRLAADYHSLPSAIFSVQRVRDQSPLDVVNWPEVFAARIRDNTAAWLSARFTLLRSDILKPHERIWLLDQCKDFWAGAENEPEFQNSVGWILRRLVKHQDPPLDVELSAVFASWIVKIAPAVDRTNFFLTWALRYAPETARTPALQWIQSRPRLFQTHYLIIAWLECGLPPHEIRDSVVEWCRRHGNTFEFSFVGVAWLHAKANADAVRDFALQWLNANSQALHAHFLLAAWLEYTGDTDAVRGVLEQWLATNKTFRQAGRVFTSWLRASGEPVIISDALADWFSTRQTAGRSLPVYREWLRAGGSKAVLHRGILQWLERGDGHPVATRRALARWLDSGGDRESVRQHLGNWLVAHGTTVEASFVFQSWLRSDGDLAFVQVAIQTWMKLHSTQEDARYVCTAWLDAGGELPVVREAMLARFQEHTTDPDAQFEYRAWLDGGGSIQEAAPFISRWLARNQTEFDARFVYKAWLEAGGDKNLVRQPIHSWLEQHGLTFEASFVYPRWLEAGGEIELVTDFIGPWLKRHATTADASFIYEFWLKRGGGTSSVRSHVRDWITLHAEIPQARFVYKAWLEAGGEFALIESAVLRWMERNQAESDSIFITRLIARERQLSDQTLKRLITWTATLPQPDKCISSFSQLGIHLRTPSLRTEIAETAERLLTPLLKPNLHWDEFVQGDTAIVLSFLLDSTRGQSDPIRRRVDSLFLQWIRHPQGGGADTKRYPNIQRVEWLRRVGDLLASGELDVARDRLVLEQFLRWVDSWEAWRKAQHQTISAIESLKRRFPAPHLWDSVRSRPQFHPQPRRNDRFRRQ